MAQKIRNTKKVDSNGNLVKDVKAFKAANPDAIIYDSKFEWTVFNMLQDAGFIVEFKPAPLVMVEKITAVELDYTIDQKKELRKALRQVTTKPAKSKILREFNVNNEKSLTENTVLPLTWSIDFYLPEHDLYVEAKGFPNDTFPLKLKLAYKMLLSSDKNVAVVKTRKDCNDLIKYLTN